MPNKKLTLLIATGNAHKVEEISAILSPLKLQILSTKTFPDGPDPIEDGETYFANAMIKAREWYEHTGLLTLADDSGLEVTALNGRPGIHSSRYAETNPARIAKMIGEMKQVPLKDRQARFVCSVVLLGPNGIQENAEGTLEGYIAQSPKGEMGFGYDPIFIPDGFGGKHLAELSEETKNSISHRGNALQKLIPILENIIKQLG